MLRALVNRFRRAERGSAGFEMVLWIVVIVIPIANLIDIGIYVVQNLQLRGAAQAAVQSIRATCRNYDPPLSVNCGATAMRNAATAGAQTGQLGTRVTVDNNFPTEGYYCATTSGAANLTPYPAVGNNPWVVTGTPAAKPTPPTCPSRTDYIADYVQVKVNHTYTPMFTTVSVASLLPSQMSAIAWARMQ